AAVFPEQCPKRPASSGYPRAVEAVRASASIRGRPRGHGANFQAAASSAWAPPTGCVVSSSSTKVSVVCERAECKHLIEVCRLNTRGILAVAEIEDRHALVQFEAAPMN